MNYFRKKAWFLLLIGIPLLLLWTWEGIIAITSPSSPIIGAYRISNWLIPCLVSLVFGYGIAQTEPDPRLAVLGLRDPRSLWLERWGSYGLFILLGITVIVLLISFSFNVAFAKLASTTLVTSCYGMAWAWALHIWTGARANVIAWMTLSIMLLSIMLPILINANLAWSLTPTPLGWQRENPLTSQLLLHHGMILAISGGLIAAARWLPNDIRSLAWIHADRGFDA